MATGGIKTRKVCIVIPAHNEENRIKKTLEAYAKFFKEKKRSGELDFEILVVINNTRDRTEEIVKGIARKYKEIGAISFREGGKGFAIIQGFKDALKRDNNLIGFVDADNSTTAEEYFKLIKEMGSSDGVIASRYVPGAKVSPKQPISRIAVSRVGNLIIRSLFFLKFRDTQCGAKVFRRKVIESVVPLLSNSQWGFDIDLLYIADRQGYQIKEFPTVWSDAKDSKLKLNKVSVQVLFAALRLRVLNSPMKRSWKFVEWFARVVQTMLK